MRLHSKILFLVIVSCWIVAIGGVGYAQTLIRDTEMEQVLANITAPLLKVAGLSSDTIDLYVIKSDEWNAFVAGGANMFLYTGLIEATDYVEELQGVIAHELGHIAGGHIARSSEAYHNSSLQSLLTSFLSIGAAVLAGSPEIGLTGLLAAQGVTQRQLLAYSRTQESAADQAALRYLTQARINVQGLYTFIKKLYEREGSNTYSPYLRSHPLTQQRLHIVKTYMDRTQKPPPTLQKFVTGHARIKAKLTAFLNPEHAIRLYKGRTTIAQRYGYAIALYRQGQAAKAVSLLNALLLEEPDNPFFHEIRAQILMEHGYIHHAIKGYTKAVNLLPQAGLLQMRLASLLIETNEKHSLSRALEHLRIARDKNVPKVELWRLFSIIYGRQEQKGLLYYARAEQMLALGDIKQALYNANQAIKILPTRSSEWLRTQDIKNIALNY